MLKRILRNNGYEIVGEADNGLTGVEKYQGKPGSCYDGYHYAGDGRDNRA